MTASAGLRYVGGCVQFRNIQAAHLQAMQLFCGAPVVAKVRISGTSFVQQGDLESFLLKCFVAGGIDLRELCCGHLPLMAFKCAVKCAEEDYIHRLQEESQTSEISFFFFFFLFVSVQKRTSVTWHVFFFYSLLSNFALQISGFYWTIESAANYCL